MKPELNERLRRLVATALRERDGFTLPVVLFAMIIMSAVAVGMLKNAFDEGRGSSSMLESVAGFYAAEAGLDDVMTGWPDSLVDSLEPFDSVEVASKTLEDGSRYRATIRRIDNGGQKMYLLTSRGTGAHARAGKRELKMVLTEGAGAFPKLGALVVRGGMELGADDRGWGPGCGWGCRDNSLPWVVGDDTPPSRWDPAQCEDDPMDNVAAILIDDSTNIHMHPENDGYHQAPSPASESIDDPVVQDGEIDDETFTQFGNDLDLEALISKADHVLPAWDGCESCPEKRTTYPTLNADGTCNTSDPYNWGSPDPNHPCFDYHPIIHVPDGAYIRGTAPDGTCGYGQAIVVANGPLKFGHHTCQTPSTAYQFAGIAIVKGCIELLYWTRFYGTAFVDDDMSGSTHSDCDISGGFEGNGVIGNKNTLYNFSSCAVDKAFLGSGAGASILPLTARSFLEELL